MVIPYICMSTFLFITIAFLFCTLWSVLLFSLPPLYYLYVLSKKHCTTDIMHLMPWKRSVQWLGTAFLLTELIILSHMVLYISLYSCLWYIFEQHIVWCIFMYILATPPFISMFFGVTCIMGLLSGQVISIPLYLFKFLLKPYLQYLCSPYIQIETDIRINFSSHWTNICDFTVYWVAILTSVIAMSRLALFFISSSISFCILLRSFFCFLNFSRKCFFSSSSFSFFFTVFFISCNSLFILSILSCCFAHISSNWLLFPSISDIWIEWKKTYLVQKLSLALLSIIFPYCLWYNTNFWYFWLLIFEHTISSLLLVAIINCFIYSLLNKWNLHDTF